MGGLLQSFPHSLVKTCFNIRIAVIVGVILTSFGLSAAQEIEEPTQPPALTELGPGLYEPDIGGMPSIPIRNCMPNESLD